MFRVGSKNIFASALQAPSMSTKEEHMVTSTTLSTGVVDDLHVGHKTNVIDIGHKKETLLEEIRFPREHLYSFQR